MSTGPTSQPRSLYEAVGGESTFRAIVKMFGSRNAGATWYHRRWAPSGDRLGAGRLALLPD